MPRIIEISHRTIIFAVLFIGLIWLVLQISSIILGLFVAFLLMTALNPLVDMVSKLGIPRSLSILVVYLLVIGIFIAGLTGVVPPLIEQTTNLVNRAPVLFDQLTLWLGNMGVVVDRDLISQQATQLGTIPANLVRVLISFFSNLIGVFTVLVITFYLLLERKNLDRYLLVLFGQGGEKQAKSFADKLEVRLLALTVSPVIALATAALYFIVQQAENVFILPKVMQKATGVNPLVTIVALGVGFKLAGVIGAVLAVPILIVLHLLALEVFLVRHLRTLEDSQVETKK